MRCLLPSLLLLAWLPLAAAAQDDASLAAFLATGAVHLDGVYDEVARFSGADPLPGGQRITSRSVHHADLRIAEDHAVALFAAMPDLAVRTEELQGEDVVNGKPVSLPGLRNIIAELPGAEPDLPALVVSAHLDSTASSDVGWDPVLDPAPGADDDASGVAVVVGLARAMSAWETGFARTVRFVLFTAEEIGLQGSEAHVDALPDSHELHLVIQLDPVGFNAGGEDRLWFTYDGRWPESVDLVDAAAGRRGSFLAVQGVNRALLGAQAERSDHVAFWDAGFRAVHFGAFPPPPDYHRATDTLDVVDPAFLREVAGLMLELVAGEAGPLPEGVAVDSAGCGCGHSGHPRDAPSWLLMVLLLAATTRRKR